MSKPNCVVPERSVVSYLRGEPRVEYQEIRTATSKEAKNGTSNGDYVVARKIEHRGEAFGVLVAIPVGDSEYAIGYSVMHPDDSDLQFFTGKNIYCRKHGLKIAVSRAQSKSTMKDMPFIVDEEINNFIDRCEKYYRGCKKGDLSKKGHTIKESQPKRTIVKEQEYLYSMKSIAERSYHRSQLKSSKLNSVQTLCFK